MTSEENNRSALWRLSSIGIELMAAIAGLGLLGYWIDRRFDTAPAALLIGLGIGMVGGLYNAIRSALKASRESAEESAGESARKRGPGNPDDGEKR